MENCEVSGEDIFKCIESYICENRLDSQCLNAEEMEYIKNLIFIVREHSDYKTLMDWPFAYDRENISKEFVTVCENALFDHGNPHKLCFRALTLFIFANDLCKYRLKDNGVKNTLMTIVKKNN